MVNVKKFSFSFKNSISFCVGFKAYVQIPEQFCFGKIEKKTIEFKCCCCYCCFGYVIGVVVYTDILLLWCCCSCFDVVVMLLWCCCSCCHYCWRCDGALLLPFDAFKYIILYFFIFQTNPTKTLHKTLKTFEKPLRIEIFLVLNKIR